MVIYCYSKKLTLLAAASEVEIWRYSVPDGFKITVLEQGFILPSDGQMDGYVDEVKLDDLDGDLIPSIDDRAVVNRELEQGQEWVYKGSSVAGGVAGILLIYDKVKI